MRGAEVLWAAAADQDSEAVLAVLSDRGRPPDIIISDYRLRDGRTGIDVIERIRRTFCTPIPAFLISGDTAPDRLR
jgi:CheY-like chemotaxis protein